MAEVAQGDDHHGVVIDIHRHGGPLTEVHTVDGVVLHVAPVGSQCTGDQAGAGVVFLRHQIVHGPCQTFIDGLSGNVQREEIAVATLLDVLPDGLYEGGLLVGLHRVLEPDMHGVGIGVVGHWVAEACRAGHVAVHYLAVGLLQTEEDGEGLPDLCLWHQVHDGLDERVKVSDPHLVVTGSGIVPLAEQLPAHELHLRQRGVAQDGGGQFLVPVIP